MYAFTHETNAAMGCSVLCTTAFGANVSFAHACALALTLALALSAHTCLAGVTFDLAHIEQTGQPVAVEAKVASCKDQAHGNHYQSFMVRHSSHSFVPSTMHTHPQS